MVFATDLPPGVDHELAPREGKTVSGRILAPEPVAVFSMSVYSHRLALHELAEDDDEPDDHYRVDGLPEDEYLVSVQANAGKHYYRGEVRVKTGEQKDLVLKRSK
jgi:hypothetical protein